MMHPTPVNPIIAHHKAAGITLPISRPTAADRARSAILRAVQAFWLTAEERHRSPDKRPGEDVLAELIATTGQALARLGDRKGERADAARRWLTEQRDAYLHSLEVFASVGPDLRGPAVVDMLARITQAEVDADVCEVSFAAAPPDRAVLAGIRSDWDVAIATANEGVREAEALAASLARPRLVDLQVFGDADRDCRALERTTPYRAQFEALKQAFEAGPDLARLWPVYESAKPGAELARLYELRAGAYVEAHP